jgi:hypothetical protein
MLRVVWVLSAMSMAASWHTASASIPLPASSKPTTVVADLIKRIVPQQAHLFVMLVGV